MRKAAVVTLVAGAYAMMIGILLLIVLALTTAFADGWAQRAEAKVVADRAPQFSPDGSQIAFIRTDGDASPRLWVMSEDGTDQRPLSTALRFSWAGRGSVLLFSRDRRVYRIDANGGSARPAHDRLRARDTTSRDRKVFVRGNHVYLRDADGREQKLT
jgi:dipeptidyl aminopeptidase/acylaminoacyl peptidase